MLVCLAAADVHAGAVGMAPPGIGNGLAYLSTTLRQLIDAPLFLLRTAPGMFAPAGPAAALRFAADVLICDCTCALPFEIRRSLQGWHPQAVRRRVDFG